MTVRFQEAVEFLTWVIGGYVCNGQLRFPKVTPEEILLELRMQIKGEDGAYHLTELQAKELLYLSTKQAGAYDLAAKVCAENLMVGKYIPKPLRLFAAKALTGMTTRPKGAKRDQTWMANQYKLAMVYYASKNFDLERTRGDTSLALSACDAVAKAVSNAGHHIDYFSIKRLVVERRYADLRDEARQWALNARDLGIDIAKIYPAPAAFSSHVADDESNSDT